MPAHFPGTARIGEKRFERLRETLDIPMGHEQARHAVLHDIWNPPMCTADHWLGMGHGLQKHQAKTFPPTGQGEGVTICVAGEELLRRETEEKMCMFGNTEVVSDLFESCPVVS